MCLGTKPMECGHVFEHKYIFIHTHKLHLELCSLNLGINLNLPSLNAMEIFVLISREAELSPSKLIYLFTIEYVGVCRGSERQKG